MLNVLFIEVYFGPIFPWMGEKIASGGKWKGDVSLSVLSPMERVELSITPSTTVFANAWSDVAVVHAESFPAWPFRPAWLH